jgi:hypothetical protein
MVPSQRREGTDPARKTISQIKREKGKIDPGFATNEKKCSTVRRFLRWQEGLPFLLLLLKRGGMKRKKTQKKKAVQQKC